MRRNPLLLPLLIFLTSVPCIAQENEKRPNILFLFSDDQSFETVGALGNDQIQTPSLDQLAARGTTFTHCFNMGSWSGAVCVASRTMLNSGRYVWSANAIYDKSEQERRAGRWWSEHLKSAGYKTYMTGKWHCRADAHQAFDDARHVRGGMPTQTPAGYGRPLADGSDAWSPSDPKFGGFWEGGKHWSEVVGDDAIDFIDDAAGKSQPFFMYVAFNAPHDPRQSPQEYVDRYPADQIMIPKNFLPLYPYKDEIGAGPSLRDEALGIFPRTEHCVQVHRQEYYSIITHMDAQIGRILEHLKAAGIDDNTWIFFTADHGLACGHHGLMGKQNMYDHSVRVPFTVVAPGVEAGRRISAPIYLQDVMPTTLQLAGVPKPEHVDFQSVLPLLAGQGKPRQAIYGAYLGLQRSLRTERYKLILYPKAKVARLYDLQQDPDEIHDLAAQPSARPIMRRLFAEFQRQQAELGDSLDLSETFANLK
ncbi:Arylsulfatase [Rosistilla carotiformis]|uniref:Arylsulfatase n=1 Tax=Rosistilla carotiformis TaxID=2528017 RepID=A0A518JTL1_9BACT|nr:sulfatase-like hydrolase/transferase [Rosistilla carotiformis]QDV68892.1 Arylsulfatase [Rosistilla carotiformis]